MLSVNSIVNLTTDSKFDNLALGMLGGGVWMPVPLCTFPTHRSSPVCAKKATERSLRDILVGVRKRRRVTKGGKSIAPVQLRRFHHLGFILYFLSLLLRHPPKLHRWKCSTTQTVTGANIALILSLLAIITIPVTHNRTIIVSTIKYVRWHFAQPNTKWQYLVGLHHITDMVHGTNYNYIHV